MSFSPNGERKECGSGVRLQRGVHHRERSTWMRAESPPVMPHRMVPQKSQAIELKRNKDTYHRKRTVPSRSSSVNGRVGYGS